MNTPAERVAAILAEATGQDISSWEKGFLNNVKNYKTISVKQEAILAKIEARLGIVKKEGEEETEKKPKRDQFGFDTYGEDGTLNDYPF